MKLNVYSVSNVSGTMLGTGKQKYMKHSHYLQVKIMYVAYGDKIWQHM